MFPIFRCFLVAVFCFSLLIFFQIKKKKLSKLDAGRQVRVDFLFHVHRSGESLEIRAREKKMQINDKNNITNITYLAKTTFDDIYIANCWKYGLRQYKPNFQNQKSQ